MLPPWVIAVLASPWLLLAPVNIFKISMINKPSPAAKYIVGTNMDVCQAGCNIARMWGCLFWALQFCLAGGIVAACRENHWAAAPRARLPYALAKLLTGVRGRPLACVACRSHGPQPGLALSCC
jgi:hypothetical protein